MSEYQYYEFLALDRPLSAEAIDAVRTLSRRVQPTPTHAVFTYSYGDFPGQPLDLLAKHNDIMLYLANWGSKQLAFRFPNGAIDKAILQPYYYGVEEIELRKAGDYLILNIAFHDEGGNWIEEEGHLTPLAPLRDDLLRRASLQLVGAADRLEDLEARRIAQVIRRAVAALLVQHNHAVALQLRQVIPQVMQQDLVKTLLAIAVRVDMQIRHLFVGDTVTRPFAAGVIVTPQHRNVAVRHHVQQPLLLLGHLVAVVVTHQIGEHAGE